MLFCWATAQMLTEWLKRQLYSRKNLQKINIFTGECYGWTVLVNLLTYFEQCVLSGFLHNFSLVSGKSSRWSEHGCVLSVRAYNRFGDCTVSPLLLRQLYMLSFECSVGGGFSRPIWRAQQPWFAAETRPGPKTKTSLENGPSLRAGRIIRVANGCQWENSIRWPRNTGLGKRHK